MTEKANKIIEAASTICDLFKGSNADEAWQETLETLKKNGNSDDCVLLLLRAGLDNGIRIPHGFEDEYDKLTDDFQWQ